MAYVSPSKHLSEYTHQLAQQGSLGGYTQDLFELQNAINSSPYGKYIDLPKWSSADYDWFNPATWEKGNGHWASKIEAAYQRLRDMEYENSAYQRVVDDMKKAGFNPYWIMNNGGNVNTVSNPSSYYQESSKNSTLPETVTKLAMVFAVLMKAIL